MSKLVETIEDLIKMNANRRFQEFEYIAQRMSQFPLTLVLYYCPQYQQFFMKSDAVVLDVISFNGDELREIITTVNRMVEL